MKSKSLKNKLTFHKATIATLNQHQQENVNGGDRITLIQYTCNYFCTVNDTCNATCAEVCVSFPITLCDWRCQP